MNPEELALSQANAASWWSEYAANNMHLIDRLIEIAGTPNKAMLLMMLNIVGQQQDIIDLLEGDEEDG